MKYPTLIVDDEAPAREKIAKFLKMLPESFAITFASNAEEALSFLHSQPFDLMFLDIQMPQMDAFEMLQKLNLDNLPSIIFSTAYDQYAIKAFEVHAIDYLLKPYDFDRFSEAVSRVIHLIDQKNNSGQVLQKLLKTWNPPSPDPEIIWVSKGSKLVPLEVNSIEYLESEGNYVSIFTPSHKYMLRQNLGELHAKLNEKQFIRVHRSFVVNQKAIQELFPKSHGDMFAVLKSGKRITVSRRYREQLIG